MATCDLPSPLDQRRPYRSPWESTRRPILTGLPSSGVDMSVETLETTFLLAVRELMWRAGQKPKDVPVGEQHGNIHGCENKDDVEPGVIVPRPRALVVLREAAGVSRARKSELASGYERAHLPHRPCLPRRVRTPGETWWMTEGQPRAKPAARGEPTHPAATAAMMAWWRRLSFLLG